MSSNADNHHQRRSAQTVVSLTKFAHAKSKGTRRAIEQYKQKRKSKFNRNASLLREYRKVMKKEGFEAGKGASRKRSLDDKGREIDESENGDDHEEVQQSSDSEDNNNSEEHDRQQKQQKTRRHKADPLAKAKQMAKQSKEDEIKRREMKVKEQEDHKRKLKQKQQRSRKLAKKTNRGQPVMKHVVDDLLEKIKKSVDK